MWDEFLGVFIDYFFLQELRETLAKEFVNLKQRKISVKEHALKFQHLYHYDLELVSNIRSQRRSLIWGCLTTWCWNAKLQC